MKYLTEQKVFHFKKTAVALGNFDGIHKGHQSLLEEVVKAKEKQLTSVIFTLNPHPSFVVSNKEAVDLIYVGEEKVKKFEELGIDVLIEYPFTLETAKMLPETFIKKILLEQLDAKIIIVGNDYRFGYKRQGNVSLLKKYGKIFGYKVIELEKKEINNQIISSSRIRDYIKKGQIVEANELLRTPFSIMGKVQQGRKLGRKLGFPTANIIPSKEKLLPPNGVYITKTKLNNKWYKSITNIGSNPTIGKQEHKVVETYLFGINSVFYDKAIEVILLKHLRFEKKFDSIDNLVDQIKDDIKNAEVFFEEKELKRTNC